MCRVFTALFFFFNLMIGLCIGAYPKPTTSPGIQSEQKLKLTLANVSEDVYILSQEMKRISADHERLLQENQVLKQQLKQLEMNYESLATSVNKTLEDMRTKYLEVGQQVQKAYDEYQNVLLGKVNAQVQDLAQQMQKGFDQLSEAIKKVEGNAFQAIEGTKKVIVDNSKKPVTFSEDYPHQGVVYTIQKGDTLSTIAQKLNSTIDYIKNANRLDNPNLLKAGQVIFVPQK